VKKGLAGDISGRAPDEFWWNVLMKDVYDIDTGLEFPERHRGSLVEKLEE
jgi:hypothetical protein